jgi:hypothetical protein
MVAHLRQPPHPLPCQPACIYMIFIGPLNSGKRHGVIFFFVVFNFIKKFLRLFLFSVVDFFSRTKTFRDILYIDNQ